MGVQVQVAGIFVSFPFEPYDVQKTYMEKVIESLQKGSNAVLESPTGTGKTLCLLCATLAWLEVRKAQQQANIGLLRSNLGAEEANLKLDLAAATGMSWNDQLPLVVPKIIYSSRTHSQLSQVVHELKRSDYRHVKAVVVGSRDQLCLHPDVMKETSSSVKIHLCRAKVNARTCSLYNRVEVATADINSKKSTVVDIEDLIGRGNKQNCCPYYLSRSLKQDADIIFMPYNYLLDEKARKSHSIELEGNIVIFDEAHNVGKICEESVSMELRSQDIAACISEVTQLMQMIAFRDRHSNDLIGMEILSAPDFTLDELCILKTMFCELEEQIEAIPLSADTGSATFPGNYIFELLSKVELNFQKKDVILEFIDKLVQYLTSGSPNPTMRRGGGLQKFADMIRVIFSHQKVGQSAAHSMVSCYKVYVSYEDLKKKQHNDLWTVVKSVKQPRTLNYWCFNPGVGMKNMMEQKARCIILTSGTLAPLNTFITELHIPFPIRLENPHIIQKKQLWVGIVSRGPDGTLLNSSFQNRSSSQYVTSLGNTIVNFARVIPNGLLVFFPSYSVMSSCQKAWEESNLWQSISNQKTIFMENQSKRDFHLVVEDFYRENSNKASRGGVFMAVCRGKVSEGLDFADGNGRAVIVTGLPFPPWKDPKVTLKMAYLDDQLKLKKEGFNGNEWYRLEASRAVNQAIGRVIRHKDDYGAIILCDNRFGDRQFQMQLSSWLRPHIQPFSNFGPALKGVSQFFKQINGKIGSQIRNVSLSSAPPSTANPVSSRQSPPLLSKDNNFSGTHKSDCEWSSELSMYSSVGKNRMAPSTTVSRRGSVFDALGGHGESESVSSAAPYKHLLNRCEEFDSLTCVAAKKKKFNVVGPGVKSNPISPAATQTCSRELAASSVQVNSTKLTGKGQEDSEKNSADYLLKMLKTLLSDEDYSSFRSAIKTYSKDRDVGNLAATVASICPADNPKLLDCFRSLRKFVAVSDRVQFDEYLDNILKK